MSFLSDRIASWFGISKADREATVAAMLASGGAARGGYWLQLATAMVIAILGLVLGSTAVVIGAMLVSPLMTPIIHLGMGLAVGSPLLVVRSSLRIIASCLVVVLGAGLVVLALPFHETTSEIASRTSPTALDLAIASCCAIAGLYAAIRQGSDTTSTAAGTAIGIALVPPLCVVGYGIGTGDRRIASGAALLFTANLCAIILFSVVGFMLFGYGSVSVRALERAHAEELAPTRITGRIARRLSLFFASRAAGVVKIAMPLALVVVVFLPLRTALAQVEWEVRVRSAVKQGLQGQSSETVKSSVRIEGRAIFVRAIVIGDAAAAATIRATLSDRIRRVAPESVAAIEVLTVANSNALAATRATVPEPSIVSPPAGVRVLRGDLERGLASWPADVCGELIAWNVAFPKGAESADVTVFHLGAPLGGAAQDMLQRSLGGFLGGSVRITDMALSTMPLERDVAEGSEWLVGVVRELVRADTIAPRGTLSACIEVPRDADSVSRGRVLSTLAAHPRAVMRQGDGARWSFRWSAAACASDSDAGAPEAGSASSPDGAHDAGARELPK